MNKSNRYTRRSFLRKSAVNSSIGLLSVAGLTASCRDGANAAMPTGSVQKALTQGSSSVVTRKNIAGLAADDPELKLFRDAVGILRERSERWPLDPVGWTENGALHTKFCASSVYQNQVHYSWYVWPWHRAYLWTLEKKLQEAVREPQLALHYWDWTKTPRLPTHYLDEGSSLYNDTRRARADDVIPFDFLNLGSALRAKAFTTFGGYPFPNDEGGPQIDGITEQSFHNNIHNWIGGDMAGFVAAGYDPLFYGHHGNCDRFWQAWLALDPDHRNPTHEDWLEKTFYFTDERGKPITIRIKDVLDTERLGYRFADLNFDSDDGNYRSVESRVIPSFDLVKSSGVYNATIKQEKDVQAAEEVSLEDASHVRLTFRRAKLPYMPYCSRVYFVFDGRELTAESGHYVGTFTILPIVSAQEGLLEKDVHMHAEITGAIRDQINAGGSIRVYLEPVQVRGRNIPNNSVSIEDVTFVMV